jgi:glucose-1-phosphate adenylyltransferase
MLLNKENIFRTLTFIVPSRGEKLAPLTGYRPQPLLPFGPDLRVIDFILSNSWNSGLRRAFVLPPDHADAVGQHAGAYDWDGNLTVIHPDTATRQRSAADALLQNWGLVQLAQPENILVLTTSHLYEMTYESLLRNHVERGSGVTVAQAANREIGAYVFKTQMLRRVLLANSLAGLAHDIDRASISRVVSAQELHTFDLSPCSSAYWGPVDTIDNYYRSQLRFAAGSENPQGVISRLAEIDPTACVENSILLKGVRIGANSRIRKAIIEEDMRIPDGTLIGFNMAEDRQRFVVSDGGVVVVDRDAVTRMKGPQRGTLLVFARAA